MGDVSLASVKDVTAISINISVYSFLLYHSPPVAGEALNWNGSCEAAEVRLDLHSVIQRDDLHLLRPLDA